MRSGRVANLKVETTEASRRAYSIWPRATSASDPTTTSDIRNLPIPACDGRTESCQRLSSPAQTIAAIFRADVKNPVDQ